MWNSLMYLGAFTGFLAGALLGQTVGRAIMADIGQSPSALSQLPTHLSWSGASINVHRLQSTPKTTIVWTNTSIFVVFQPARCGEYGDFTLNWDYGPTFHPSSSDEFLFPPVFNPYHHLFFSNGYAYAPPPDSPFMPVSPPCLAVFLPNSTTQDVGSPSAGGARPGEIGAGPRAPIDAFWFNAYGAYLGCDNSGPEKCEMAVRGFKYDALRRTEVLVAQQSITVAPCPDLKDCRLHNYDFDFGTKHKGLSGLQISATSLRDGKPRIFFMDNLRMGWYNNTCEAGLVRQMSRK